MKSTFIKTCLNLTLTSSLSLAFAYSALAVEAERQLELSATSLDSLFVDAGAGSLTIQGKPGLKQIEVNAKILVDGIDDDEAKAWFKKHMTLTLTEDNGKATLKSLFNKNSSFNWFSSGWGSKERKIDLLVYIPENLQLKVDDGSGWAKVNNIQANVEIDDGSGTLTLTNIGGDLYVDDGSGNLSIENVGGNLRVNDGSGKLFIDRVSGKVDIEDGSGGIKITNVAKNVYIDDGSGSVDACHLEGDLTVDDGSGSVDTCDDIKGQVVVK